MAILHSFAVTGPTKCVPIGQCGRKPAQLLVQRLPGVAGPYVDRLGLGNDRSFGRFDNGGRVVCMAFIGLRRVGTLPWLASQSPASRD
jgi:hypothetical protein